ncbi:MAG TPA: cytochrome b/b6 domain-containing protein [Caulobacteraceae bacterium]|nr:cytochrome b/b6 domain-containing protein [Caulobacteraceae bacterium]
MLKDRPAKGGGTLVYRHSVVVRLAHWVNLACLVLLLLSGLQILCAHPAFYWGEASDLGRPLAAVSAVTTDAGAARGVLTLGGARFDTTGLLGVSTGADGAAIQRAFPAWATLPAELDLGAGRRWHFFVAWVFVANGVLYLGSGLVTGRLKRTLVPRLVQLRELGRTALDHLRLKFPRGEAAREYNGLQKLTYLAVVLGLLPLMLATGLSMSPTVDAWLPALPALLGGRQSARTIHFAAASTLVLFAAVHVAMVLLSGPINEVRSMITGWFRLDPERTPR